LQKGIGNTKVFSGAPCLMLLGLTLGLTIYIVGTRDGTKHASMTSHAAALAVREW
jgi:hypothetical protein